MRIKWTSIPSVMAAHTAASSLGNGVPERVKPEPMNEREPNKKQKKKKSEQRSFDWLRRSR
jgi:hypothetical protein